MATIPFKIKLRIFKIFKKINKLLLAGGLVFLLAACSDKQVTTGDMMMKSIKSNSEKEALALQWKNGSELLKKGKEQKLDGEDMIEEGNDLVDDGNDEIEDGNDSITDGKKLLEDGNNNIKEGRKLVDDGNNNIKEGTKLIETSERIFKEKFPGVSLKK